MSRLRDQGPGSRDPGGRPDHRTTGPRSPVPGPWSLTYSRIYAVIRRIPQGRVATYGQVAKLAGIPGQARRVGYALSALPDHATVPWHRVINARGEISPRADPGLVERIQRALLEAEGVEFDEAGKVDLARYLWRPRTRGGTGKRAGGRG